MPISKIKRLPALLLLPLAAAAAYAYPRRLAPDIFSLVPRDGLAVCVRARGLGDVWRRCSRSEFGRKVAAGGIFPIDEMIASDKKRREEWEDLDTRFWPEIFGRDCVFALYAPGGGAPPRAAAWARVGFRTRLFHLWKRTHASVCFWRAKRIRTRRVGVLAVSSLMNRKRGTVDASYVLLGDLGIATAGRGDGFWERVSALAEAGPGGGGDARGVVAEVLVAAGGRARGALFADLGALRRCGDGMARAAAASPRGGRGIEALWGPSSALFAGLTAATATFDIGERIEAEARVVGARGAGRPLSGDPLEGAMAQGGLLYAAGWMDPGGLLDRARAEWPDGGVAFGRRGGVESFPAGHFSLGWLGGEWAFLLYLDPRGMLNAAASFRVSDRRLARERIARFMKLADGAVVSLVDGRGGAWTPFGKPLDVGLERGGEGLRYRVGLGAPIEYLYDPVVILREGRLVVASGDPVRAAAGARGTGDAAGKLILRGSDMDQAAASVRQILAIAAAFTEKRRDRGRIAAAQRALGALEWLAPVREARLYLKAVEGGTRVSLSAELADIRAP